MQGNCYSSERPRASIYRPATSTELLSRVYSRSTETNRFVTTWLARVCGTTGSGSRLRFRHVLWTKLDYNGWRLISSIQFERSTGGQGHKDCQVLVILLQLLRGVPMPLIIWLPPHLK